MEPLRIRIPPVVYCLTESCFQLTTDWTHLCSDCRLHARVRQEVAPAALSNEPKLVHRPPLRRYLSG